jgi:hypothetical protein
MAALVSAEEFSTFLGIAVPTGLKLAQMNMFLTDVSDWARELAGKAWLLPDDAPATVRGIVKASCRREWSNPKRVAYLVKGPQSASFIQSAYPPGFFTDAEERRLIAYGRAGSSGDLFTVDTYRDEIEELNGYLEVYPHGGLMPVYNPDDLVGYPGSIHP